MRLCNQHSAAEQHEYESLGTAPEPDLRTPTGHRQAVADRGRAPHHALRRPFCRTPSSPRPEKPMGALRPRRAQRKGSTPGASRRGDREYL
ncbi:MAG: hypothetical protein ACPIOQ_12585 [Promethearchaeia archaeon]